MIGNRIILKSVHITKYGKKVLRRIIVKIKSPAGSLRYGLAVFLKFF